MSERPMRRTAFGLSILVLSGLVACAPPAVVPEPAVELDGANLDELLDRYTNTRRDPGSDMRLLIDGPDSRAAFTELIESARHHLHIETLYFEDDRDRPENISLAIAKMLSDQAGRGTAVRLLVDPLAQDFAGSPELEEIMADGGVEVRRSCVPGPAILDEMFYGGHKKILLADGDRAIIGGMNYGYVYFTTEEWRDTNVLLTGPVVATIQREFLHDWGRLGSPAPEAEDYFPTLEPTGDLAIRAMDQRPSEGHFDINTAVLIAIRSATETIDIEAGYFNPIDWMADALFDAVARGVRVRVLVNSYRAVDWKEVYFVAANWFDVLVEHGVELYLWERDQTLHSKAMTVDDTFAFVGSYNFNYRSIVWDTENVVIFTDPPAIEQVRRMVEDDFTAEGVIRVDRAWLQAVPMSERALWRAWWTVGWLF